MKNNQQKNAQRTQRGNTQKRKLALPITMKKKIPNLTSNQRVQIKKNDEMPFHAKLSEANMHIFARMWVDRNSVPMEVRV